jgi:signal transduction histidine kinase
MAMGQTTSEAEGARAASGCTCGFAPASESLASRGDRISALEHLLHDEHIERRRAECKAQIQDQAAKIALDLIVKQPDIAGFFAGFTQKLVEETESHACAVWLLDDEKRHCELWMAHLHERLYTPGQDGWDDTAVPHLAMSEHLFDHKEGWTRTVAYPGQDARLPEPVRVFNARERVELVTFAPLVLGANTLGWIGLSTGDASACEQQWGGAFLEAIARQATLVLHQNRLADQRRLEDRRKAVLEERNRLARDIHDTLAQGFGAILMQLQSAQRESAGLPPRVANSLDAAVNLARTHLVDARRSVAALRPLEYGGRDITAGLKRLAETARLTTDVPIELLLDELPTFDMGVEREIIGIAQEALTNATRHARARRITIQASSPHAVAFRLSVADDGRGIANDRRGTGFGMTSMQERADRIGASLTIVTAPRAGTEVVLAWEPPPQSAN